MLFLSTSFATMVFDFQLFHFSDCFLSFKVAFVVLTAYRCLKFLFFGIQNGENSLGKEQLSKCFREQLAIPGVDSLIGHSGRCPRYWLHGEKKTGQKKSKKRRSVSLRPDLAMARPKSLTSLPMIGNDIDK